MTAIPRHDTGTDTAANAHGRRPEWLAGQGFALPRHTATTAHLRAVYPFAVEAGLGSRGVLLGRNHLTGGGFFFDLFEAYDAGLIQGPNAVVSGAGAHGKSAAVKAYVHRASSLRTAGRRRFVSVIDPKGEWLSLGHRLGWTSLTLRPGGDVTINPLDAGPPTRLASAREAVETEAIARRSAVTNALLAVALGQAELTAPQRRLVTAVHAQLARSITTTTPTLTDVRSLLADPPTELADRLDTTHAEVLDRRRDVLDALADLLEHDLRGICDGATSIDLDWMTTPGLVLDLSALLSHRRALRLVLTAATGWLSGLLYAQPDRHKLTIVDEGWVALEDVAVVRYLQDQWRLGRQWGCGNVLITHAVADLRSQADDGAVQNKIAEGLLNTTSVRVFLHQNPEHVPGLLAGMGLNDTEADLLGSLPPFHALWKVGPHTAYVEHTIAPGEWAMFDTDTAMRGRSSAGVR
jgi:hypothetical protein